MPGSSQGPIEGSVWTVGRLYVATVALVVAHGALFTLAFAPYNLWPLIFLAPAPLALAAIVSPSTRHVLLVTLVCLTAMWLWISRWLWQITEAGLVPYALAMAGYGMLGVWLIRRVGRHRRLGRLPMMLTLPVLWVGFEFFRGEILFDGYPWFLLAHPVIEAPLLAQSADLLGAYAVSFLVAMVAGLLVDLARRYGPETVPHSALRPVTACGLVVAVFAANLGYGSWRMGQRNVLSPGPAMLVIQTNLPQDNKLLSTADEHWQHFQTFLAQTSEAHRVAQGAGQHVDLIVWPETMVQGFGLERETTEFFRAVDYWPGFRFALATEVAATELRTPMLVGSPAYLGVRWSHDRLSWDLHYNSAYLVEPLEAGAEHGRVDHQRYDKVFLTPFGETMPYIRAWPWLEQQMLSVGAQGMQFNLDHGTEPRVLTMHWSNNGDQQVVRLATPICFEATMMHVCRSLVYEQGDKRADVMVNLTNDGWFGTYDPGRVQHAQISRFRAIENRVPLVRAANTGMSISIDSSGRVVDTIGEGSYGSPQLAASLIAEVQLDARHTLYGRIGNVLGWTCLGLLISAVAGIFWFRKEEEA